MDGCKKICYTVKIDEKDRLAGKNMKITIACVGKIKEKFYRDAILEYENGWAVTVNWNS